MLQFIVQFLPLIFLCAAFGVVLLNFDSVAAYIVYVISMLTQPKELLNASSDLSTIPLPPSVEKKQFSPFTPFIRLYTLFVVLFFPNLDYEKITGKKSKKITDVQVNVYEEKTQEEINKYRIKTYSVPSDNNLKSFRNSMEATAPLSSTFQQAFPDVVNIMDKINKIENPLAIHPKPQVLAQENNITNTLPSFQAYDVTAKMDSMSQTETPPLPPPLPPTQSNSNEPEKFDAIAALERKVSELKSDTVKTVVSPTNYSEMTMPNPTPLPRIETRVEDRPAQTHTFGNPLTNSVSIPLFSIISKLLIYTILSIPLLLVIGSIGYFFVLNGYDINSLSGYPGWVTKTLEEFVKTYIIKN